MKFPAGSPCFKSYLVLRTQLDRYAWSIGGLASCLKASLPAFLTLLIFNFKVKVIASTFMSDKLEEEGATCWKRWWKQLNSRLGAC